MEFLHSGFLGPIADQFKKQNHKDYKRHFDICFDLNVYSHQVLQKTVTPRTPAETDKVAAICLHLRALCSFASSVKLMEDGLCADAGSTVRSLMETAIILRKCAIESEWIYEFLKADDYHKISLANVVINEKEMADHHEETIKIKDQLEKYLKEENVKKLVIDSIAKEKDVGAKKIYDLYYRKLSNKSTHTTAASLNHFMKANDKGEYDGILYDNQSRTIPDLMIPCCWGLQDSTASIAKIFGLGISIPDELNSRMVNLFLPALRQKAEELYKEPSD